MAPRTTRTRVAVAAGLSLAVLLSGVAITAGCGGTPLPAEKRQISFSFPDGRPGEAFVITLASVTLAGGEDGPLVVTLRRAEPPAASLKAARRDRLSGPRRPPSPHPD